MAQLLYEVADASTFDTSTFTDDEQKVFETIDTFRPCTARFIASKLSMTAEHVKSIIGDLYNKNAVWSFQPFDTE